jgi:hypothetical protein
MFWISVVFLLVQKISFRSTFLLEIDLEMIVIVKYIRSISKKYWDIKQTLICQPSVEKAQDHV